MAKRILSAGHRKSPKPPKNPDRWLDRALEEQNDALFNAQAIIQACAHGIEENFGEQMDSNENNCPSYPRALQEAARMIERAAGQLEMMALRARAVTLEVKDKEVRNAAE